MGFSSNEQQLAKDHIEIQAPFGSFTSGGRRAAKDGAAAPKVTIFNRHIQRKIQIKSESKFLESTPFFFNNRILNLDSSQIQTQNFS